MQFCAEPACGVLVTTGRCAVHRATVDRARGTFRERGYSSRWTIRARAFRRRYPLCGMRPEGRAPVGSSCHEAHAVTLATVVDHVTPHRGEPGLMWDELGNWQSLCAACHSRKTAAGL